ncbi:MAG: [protein-PII] uridylyltransferase [Marinicellaceae bacterium]
MRLAPPFNAENYLDVLSLQNLTPQPVSFYKKLLSKAENKNKEEFDQDSDVIDMVRIRGWYVEQIIIQLWQHFIQSKSLSLIAVGGFGRGDLHPYSDVDLLILKPNKKIQHDENISAFIQSLWDIGLDVGSSVRTTKECFQQAKEDVTIATNLMESRFVLGQFKSFKKMQKLVSAKRIWKGQEFFVAKWKEQKLRHKKFSDTTYNVEPNLKEGPGGLRDIQMISWVAQRFFRTNSLHHLVDSGFLTEHEYIRLKKGQNFLWKVRYALHIIAGRKEDRVLFTYQLKLAKFFGFHDEGRKNPAVEQFMQIFYRNTMRLERLNRRLLQLFDENILKENHKDSVQNLNKRFHIVNDFLEIKNETLFQTNLNVWFELFLLIQKNPQIQGVRADTVRAMRHNIDRINHDFREDTAVKQQFLSILQQDHKVASVLNQMNRLGILARYMPVFGRIVGRMQFDLFHIYTVDQHSLFAVRNLCLLRHNKTQVKNASKIFKKIQKPYLVYIAALFHDIAKGREGHHADLGAIDAADFCQLHGINEEDSKLVVWLVKDHLIMSETAQKRDLSDPDIIQIFSESVGTMLRLRALYLLTIADISATDPKLWNSFKESLLHELFIKTKHFLNDSKQNISIKTIKDSLAKQLKKSGINDDIVNKHFNDIPDDFYNSYNAQDLLKIHHIICRESIPHVAILSNNANSTEFLFYCYDFKGLLYLILSILEKYNYTVVDANINNTKSRMALNTIHCLSDNSDENKTMIEELKLALSEQKLYDIAIERFTPRREKVFKIQPTIEFLQSNNENDSLIEVICRDRHGLLPIIAKTLLSLNISINAAKIVTVGVRAEFTYWLSINNQALNKSQLKQLENNLLEIL